MVKKSEPIVRNNKIHDCGVIGIEIFKSKGLFEENEVFIQRLYGIFSHSGSEPIVRNNYLHHNKGKAIETFNSKGVFKPNELEENGRQNESFSGITLMMDDDILSSQIYNKKEDLDMKDFFMKKEFFLEEREQKKKKKTVSKTQKKKKRKAKRKARKKTRKK